MIENPNTDGGAPEGTVISMPGIKLPSVFKPVSNYIQIDYRRNGSAGGIVMPGNAKPLEFVTARVLAVGPDCKTVQKGDKIVVATKGIHGGDNGITIDGEKAYFTQESLVVAVVAEPKAS